MNEICQEVREEAALLGRAPETERLREHSASCPECSKFVESLVALESEIAALGEKDASDDMVAKLLLRPELRGTRKTHWRTWAMSIGTAASVALVAWFWTRPDLPYRQEGEGYFRSLEPPAAGAPPVGGRVDQPSRPAPRPSEEQRKELESLDFIGRDANEGDRLQKRESAVEGKLGSLDDFQQSDKKDQDTGKGLLFDERMPAKRVQIQPVYPEGAKNARVQGTVILELTVDREGNVSDVRVLQSVPLLDQAAIDAARQWKYAPSDSEAPRVFNVSIPFTLEAPEKRDDRGSVDGLSFRQPTGYWANTYLPGDPAVRRLEARFRGTCCDGLPLLHRAARRAPLPLDPSSTAALSLYVHADRRGITEKSRLLVQVGIRASDQSARRRPPMNVGVVLHLPDALETADAAAITSLLESLEGSQELGDRFRLFATGPGGGEVLSSESFRRGPLTVALQDLYSRTGEGAPLSLSDAMALALEKVHAGDDPTMPLGTSLVVLVAARPLEGELPRIVRLAQESAVGGVSVSAVGLGDGANASEVETLALSGQGRAYALGTASEAPGVIDRELSAAGRTVARALRLRIQLAEGVHLVDVLGSSALSEREAERVRAEEKSIDLRLARNLGIEADRGKDEDGIQIVIPAFYAGDAHTILLDVVADGPGPIAEVTARYKDLVQLKNTVAQASLALSRSEAGPGPLETSVFKDYLQYRVAEGLRAAADALAMGDYARATEELHAARNLVAHAFPADPDVALLQGYIDWLPQLDWSYLRDSLLYASALKLSTTAS